MPVFWTVSGSDFARSIKWAKKQPRLRDLLPKMPNLSNAINEAEAAIRPTLPDSAPVAVTNGTLMELVAAAKGAPDTDRLTGLQDTVNSVIKQLKDAVD